MATRPALFDPADLSPEQRHREVAAILAAAVIGMRLHRGAVSTARPTSASMWRISPESGENRLELSRETRLSVGTRGLSPRGDGDYAWS